MELTARLCAAGHELHLVASEVEEGLERKFDAKIHHVPLVKGSSLLRMWQFERAASQMAGELPVDITIGFGRTTTHDLHRAGGGCHAIYSKLLPAWKRWSPKNRLELHLERELYTSGRTKRFVVNSSGDESTAVGLRCGCLAVRRDPYRRGFGAFPARGGQGDIARQDL